ncbi:hypothetical protein PHMEG_0009259 [Phytophthora megakarya]|uniref:Uncharacterized protein n=1 Tax=Phytophthora megakarya TaxID=4795 RepID=A0A225WIF2_9STRA|nr:hypothetical protein PHMEG_0009259 [Phytophthora megakarya]
MESIIKVGPLKYAPRPGQGSNVAAVSPMELLHRQYIPLATCRTRKNGIPDSVMANLSMPYHPEELVSLVKPSTLALVHVCRQHIVGFTTASRSNRPKGIYQDCGVVTITDPPHLVNRPLTGSRQLLRRPDAVTSLRLHYSDGFCQL